MQFDKNWLMSLWVHGGSCQGSYVFFQFHLWKILYLLEALYNVEICGAHQNKNVSLGNESQDRNNSARFLHLPQ